MVEATRGGLEVEPSDVERRRAAWPAYFGDLAFRMVQGPLLNLLLGDAYSETLYVFRR